MQQLQQLHEMQEMQKLQEIQQLQQLQQLQEMQQMQEVPQLQHLQHLQRPKQLQHMQLQQQRAQGAAPRRVQQPGPWPSSAAAPAATAATAATAAQLQQQHHHHHHLHPQKQQKLRAMVSEERDHRGAYAAHASGAVRGTRGIDGGRRLQAPAGEQLSPEVPAERMRALGITAQGLAQIHEGERRIAAMQERVREIVRPLITAEMDEEAIKALLWRTEEELTLQDSARNVRALQEAVKRQQEGGAVVITPERIAAHFLQMQQAHLYYQEKDRLICAAYPDLPNPYSADGTLKEPAAPGRPSPGRTGGGRGGDT